MARARATQLRQARRQIAERERVLQERQATLEKDRQRSCALLKSKETRLLTSETAAEGLRRALDASKLSQGKERALLDQRLSGER